MILVSKTNLTMTRTQNSVSLQNNIKELIMSKSDIKEMKSYEIEKQIDKSLSKK